MDYFSENGSRVYAITNTRNRSSNEDVQIRVPVKGKKLKQFRELKKKGKDESAIFGVLFPDNDITKAVSAPDRKILIDVDRLSKQQIAALVVEEIGYELESLERMTLNDLRELLLRIRQVKKQGLVKKR